MNLAVLLSGTGRTMDNFHQAINSGRMRGEIRVVISNVAGVPGLEKAAGYGYPAHYARDDEAINRIIAGYDVDLVLLAGFLKLYTPPAHLGRRVLNIHPSLIPSFCGPGFYGMRVHRAAWNRGVTVSGCTVHFANDLYDDGPIVVQKCVDVVDCASPGDIAERVFAVECEAFPEAVNLVGEKGVDYFWDHAVGREEQ